VRRRKDPPANQRKKKIRLIESGLRMADNRWVALGATFSEQRGWTGENIGPDGIIRLVIIELVRPLGSLKTGEANDSSIGESECRAVSDFTGSQIQCGAFGIYRRFLLPQEGSIVRPEFQSA
jgi:hypothetical protein